MLKLPRMFWSLLSLNPSSWSEATKLVSQFVPLALGSGDRTDWFFVNQVGSWPGKQISHRLDLKIEFRVGELTSNTIDILSLSPISPPFSSGLLPPQKQSTAKREKKNRAASRNRHHQSANYLEYEYSEFKPVFTLSINKDSRGSFSEAPWPFKGVVEPSNIRKQIYGIRNPRKRVWSLIIMSGLYKKRKHT